MDKEKEKDRENFEIRGDFKGKKWSKAW